MKWLEDFCWFVSDRFYPRLRPLSKEASDREKELASDERSRCEEQIKSLPDDEDVVAKYLAECDALLENEESKRLNVEARLANLVGLSSITGTIVFGVILGLATGTLRVTGTILKCVIAVGALYLVLQICWAIPSLNSRTRSARVCCVEHKLCAAATKRGPIHLPAAPNHNAWREAGGRSITKQ